MRADRPERRRQDDVLQRPERVRQAGRRLDQGVRRGPAQDGRLQARALGRPTHVPDRAGDRATLGVRQRRDDLRALGGQGRGAAVGGAGGDRLRRPRDTRPGQGRRPWRPRAAPRGGGARSGGKSSHRPPRRARGRLARRGDRAPEPRDPGDPGPLRRPRRARRPRHEPRPGLLPDDRRARLREAHCVRRHRGRAPRRARDPRIPRHGGGRDEHRRRSGPGPHALVRRAVGRPWRPCGAPRRVDHGSSGRGHRAARAKRRRQVDARPRGGRRAPPHRGKRRARRARPHAAPPRADPRCRRRDRPRGAPAAPHPDRRGEPPRCDVLPQAGRGAQRDRVCARAVPGAREAVECPGSVALGRRAADGRPRAGARLPADDDPRRRALARPRAARRQAPRPDDRVRRGERRRRSPDRAVRPRGARPREHCVRHRGRADPVPRDGRGAQEPARCPAHRLPPTRVGRAPATRRRDEGGGHRGSRDDADRRRARARRAGERRGARPPRGGGPLRLRLPLLPRTPRRRGRHGPVPARPGPRVRRGRRGSRRRTARTDSAPASGSPCGR